MKKGLIVFLAAIILLPMAGQAEAALVDFTTVASGYAAGSQGTELNYSGLEITSKSGLIISGAVQSPFVYGTEANVFWGGLGNLGISGQSYTGLGVQKTGTTPGQAKDRRERRHSFHSCAISSFEKREFESYRTERD